MTFSSFEDNSRDGLQLEDQRRHAAEKEAAARRALDPQIIADAERLIEHWNERQAKRFAYAVLADDRRAIVPRRIGFEGAY